MNVAMINPPENTSRTCASVGNLPEEREESRTSDKSVHRLSALPAGNPGRLLEELQGHTGKVRCLVFSPDGRRLASGGDDNLALLWDVRSGEQQGRPLRHKHLVRALAWSPDGKRLAAGSWGGAYEGAIKVWNADDPGEPQTLALRDRVITPSGADVRGLAFSPDGSRLASGGGPVRIWDLKKEEKPAAREWQETFPSCLYALAFSPDGTRLATGSEDQTARLWSLAP